MREFSQSIQIAATPVRVWQIMSDVERWPGWTTSMTEIKRLEDTPLGVGSTVRIKQPKLRPTIFKITVWEPNHRCVWVSSGFGFTSTGDHVITPNESGSQVTLRLEFRGFLSAVVACIGGRLIRRYIALEAEGLKKRSEQVG